MNGLNNLKRSNMTHNIIKTENYLLVVDDSEIKAVDWFINLISKELLKCFKNSAVKSLGGKTINMTEKWLNNNDCKKIIAHLPLNNSPVLEGVPLLPPLEDDEAINKAKEKYKYTEEDMVIFADWYYKTQGLPENNIKYWGKNLFEVWKSLQQPKMPVMFECDMIRGLPIHNSNDVNVKTFIPFNPNTKINPQGQSVLVGKYIY